MKRIFLASVILTFFAASSFLIQMSSCTKTHAQPKTDTVYTCNTTAKGLWEGTYLTDERPNPASPVSFVFYSDGSLVLKGKGNPPAPNVILSTGSWTLNNNIISFTDTTVNYSSVVIQSGSFNYNSEQNTLTGGTWKDVTDDNGQYLTGTYSTMNKVY